MTVDPYADPGSGVLRNRLGITDPDRLAEAEASLTLTALADLDPDGNAAASMASLRGNNDPLRRLLRSTLS